ncbi:WXG100 family type VII secretion target [Nocardia sp. NPDC057440]|uniref:WXG100 family type VII secretion target n=1 Tax=Nocardia sp. NPDC057440 TaxID=3346134 RepID=UPI0036728F6D
MSDELRVEVDRLRDAARFIADKAQTIRVGVVQLDNTVGKELLSDGWQGKAASAYDESWVEWKQGADEIVAALETSAAKLLESAHRYEMRDLANSDALTQAQDQV